MEPFLADFLTNKEIPKFLRYTALVIVVGLIEFICIYGSISSPFLLGRIICLLIAAIMLSAGIYLAITKIHKN